MHGGCGKFVSQKRCYGKCLTETIAAAITPSTAAAIIHLASRPGSQCGSLPEEDSAALLMASLLAAGAPPPAIAAAARALAAASLALSSR